MTDDPGTLNARLHLFAHLEPDVLESERRAALTVGTLAGRRVGVKANIACKGARWSAGLPHRADQIAQQDAHLTRQLRTHGAQLVPGLNMDAAALGGTSDNPDFARTENPHAPGFSAGGSSGGSAAAVAAGLCDLAVGTDTLGSIRIPASYCGVFGLKPTYGLIGRSGIVPLAASLDTAGPLALQARDLWSVLKTLAGPDLQDADSRTAIADWANQTPYAEARDLRIGIPRQIGAVTCAPDVLAALAQARSWFKEAGAQICDIDMPHWHPARLRQKAFVLTEAEGAAVFAQELQTPGALPVHVEKLLSYGRSLSSAKLVSALEHMRAARAQVMRSFSEVDVLLLPTTPSRAFAWQDGPPASQADFTALANAAGVPALAVPMPVAGQALPASVQVIGPDWSEALLIGLAMLLEHQNA